MHPFARIIPPKTEFPLIFRRFVTSSFLQTIRFLSKMLFSPRFMTVFLRIYSTFTK